MKKTVMIKRRYEFKILFCKGQIYYGKNITMYLLKNKFKYNRLGIAVGKKSGNAVNRNKIKRFIRENYRISEEFIKYGYNILFSVNKKCQIKEVNFYDIKKDVEKTLKDSKLWIGINEKSVNKDNRIL